MSAHAKSLRSFWWIAYTLFITMVGTNIPASLYGMYGERWHFSSGIVTLLFALYAFTLVPTTLIFGQLSDQIGRKRVILLGVVLACIGSLVFATSQNIGMLAAARVIQGLAVGVLNGTAIAMMAELRPGNRNFAALTASVAIAIGTAIGPLLSGLLAQYAPHPIRLPYVLHIVLLIPALVALQFAPETVQPGGLRQHWRVPSVPRAVRQHFIMASLASILVWAVAGFFMSLASTFVASFMNVHSVAVAGTVVCLMLGMSTVSQIATRRFSARSAMRLGLILLLLAMTGVVLSIPLHALWLLLVSTVIAGAGHGPAAAGSLTLTSQIAPPNRRADVVSSFYAISYLGMSLLVLGLGYASQWLGFYTGVLVFATVIAVAGVAGLIRLVTFCTNCVRKLDINH